MFQSENAIQAKSEGFQIFRHRTSEGYKFELPFQFFDKIERKLNGEFIIQVDKISFLLKACKKCRTLLPHSSFYGLASPCKECHKNTVRGWQKRNPDAVKEYKSRYYYNHKEKRC